MAILFKVRHFEILKQRFMMDILARKPFSWSICRERCCGGKEQMFIEVKTKQRKLIQFVIVYKLSMT